MKRKKILLDQFSAKHLIKANIQLGDVLNKLNNDTPIKILFPSYHNKNITEQELQEKGVIRVCYDWRIGWKEISNILIKSNLLEKSNERKSL